MLEHARGLLSKIAPERGKELELEILERIGETHFALGDLMRSAEAYDSLAERAAECGRLAVQASALLRLAATIFVDPGRAIATCEEAAQLGAKLENPMLEMQAMYKPPAGAF